MEALHQLEMGLQVLGISALIFGLLALFVKGHEAIRAAKRGIAEIRLNLSWYLFDAICISPFVVTAVAAISLGAHEFSLQIVTQDLWSTPGKAFTFFAAVFLGDLFSYWRHRLEHTPWLWPAHAIHHSDTQMTWLTLSRFHPVNRIVTSCVDTLLLAMLGLPLWALAANNVFRHFYGEFIHADLPWTYGRLGSIFVSPAMHQWHHARDVDGSGSNFATVFSLFDRVFGTFHVPGPCTVALGVTEEVGTTLAQQFLYPFTCWKKEWRAELPLVRDPD